jgi:hypothetical protein
MRFNADAIAGRIVPAESHGYTRVHSAPTAFLMVPRTKSLGFTLLYGHFCL